MAYLSDVKTELKEMFDEMFRATWEVVERSLKQSYRNGMKAGQDPQAAQTDGESKRPRNRFQSKREVARNAAAEEEG